MAGENCRIQRLRFSAVGDDNVGGRFLLRAAKKEEDKENVERGRLTLLWIPNAIARTNALSFRKLKAVSSHSDPYPLAQDHGEEEASRQRRPTAYVTGILVPWAGKLRQAMGKDPMADYPELRMFSGGLLVSAVPPKGAAGIQPE